MCTTSPANFRTQRRTHVRSVAGGYDMNERAVYLREGRTPLVEEAYVATI
jgi:hypothetical protein